MCNITYSTIIQLTLFNSRQSKQNTLAEQQGALFRLFWTKDERNTIKKLLVKKVPLVGLYFLVVFLRRVVVFLWRVVVSVVVGSDGSVVVVEVGFSVVVDSVVVDMVVGFVMVDSSVVAIVSSVVKLVVVVVVFGCTSVIHKPQVIRQFFRTNWYCTSLSSIQSLFIFHKSHNSADFRSTHGSSKNKIHNKLFIKLSLKF